MAVESAQRAAASLQRYINAAQALEDYILAQVAGPCAQPGRLWQGDEGCLARTSANVNLRTTPKEVPENANFIVTIGRGVTVRVLARTQDIGGVNRSWCYLYVPEPGTHNPADYGWPLGPWIYGWCVCEYIALDDNSCSVPEIAPGDIGSNDYPTPPNPQDTTGRYYQAESGVQWAIEYAATNPGWWGDDGLDLWELMAWVIDMELYSSVLFVPEARREQFRNMTLQANYFRLRLAFEQCGGEFPCEGWYQYFSAMTAVFLTQLPTLEGCPEPPKPWPEMSPEERDAWIASLSPGWCKEHVRKFFQYSLDTNPQFEEILEGLRTLDAELGGNANWRDGLPLVSPSGATSWWSLCEIPNHLQSQYTLEGAEHEAWDPTRALYLVRYNGEVYPAGTKYIFFGTHTQKNTAEANHGESFLPCVQPEVDAPE